MRDELGSHLEIDNYGAESALSTSILGEQFAQQRWTNASIRLWINMSSRRSVMHVNLCPLLSVKMEKKWKQLTKVTVRMGLHVFLSAVWVGPRYGGVLLSSSA